MRTVKASISCDFCGEDITELCRTKKHYSVNTTPERSYCDREHRVAADVRDGHFKRMSEAGKAGRSKAMPESNRRHPRRKTKT